MQAMLSGSLSAQSAFLRSQDQDKDGFVSWEEFTGPKGSSKDEL